MSSTQETGKFEKQYKETYEETCIEWKITDIFSVIEDTHQWHSPVISFAGATLCLILYPKSLSKSDFLTLYVGKHADASASVEYSFGLKNKDGRVEHLFTGIQQENQTFSKNCNIIKLSELRRRKSELAPSDELTFTCTLKCKIVQGSALDKPKLKKLQKLDTLSENFKNLYANKDSCDVTLLVEDKEYKAHKAVLVARSPVFAATFLHEMSEKQTGVVNIPDCDAESFKEFLEFLYCGILEELSYCSAFHLYETSDKYDVQELKTFCVEFLIENLTPENLCEIVMMADKYDDKMLFCPSQKFFNENLSKVFETSEWELFLRSHPRLVSKLLKEMSKMKDSK